MRRHSPQSLFDASKVDQISAQPIFASLKIYYAFAVTAAEMRCPGIDAIVAPLEALVER